jgi:hypothetical protein
MNENVSYSLLKNTDACYKVKLHYLTLKKEKNRDKVRTILRIRSFIPESCCDV